MNSKQNQKRNRIALEVVAWLLLGLALIIPSTCLAVMIEVELSLEQQAWVGMGVLSAYIPLCLAMWLGCKISHIPRA